MSQPPTGTGALAGEVTNRKWSGYDRVEGGVHAEGENRTFVDDPAAPRATSSRRRWKAFTIPRNPPVHATHRGCPETLISRSFRGPWDPGRESHARRLPQRQPRFSAIIQPRYSAFPISSPASPALIAGEFFYERDEEISFGKQGFDTYTDRFGLRPDLQACYWTGGAQSKRRSTLKKNLDGTGPFDLDQLSCAPSPNGRSMDMNRSEQIFHSKPDEMLKSASKPMGGRQDEALLILEEYANDLRQIVAKLRGRLH